MKVKGNVEVLYIENGCGVFVVSIIMWCAQNITVYLIVFQKACKNSSENFA